MANYLDDRELYYEIIISKGKGKLTKRASDLLILIAKNVIKKKERSYPSSEDKEDCLQQGLLHIFSNWKSFNHLRFSSPFNFYTEIFKRGLVDGFYLINNRKSYQDDVIKMISIDRSNDGKGLHSF
jgi:hypothetical protein